MPKSKRSLKRRTKLKNRVKQTEVLNSRGVELLKIIRLEKESEQMSPSQARELLFNSKGNVEKHYKRIIKH